MLVDDIRGHEIILEITITHYITLQDGVIIHFDQKRLLDYLRNHRMYYTKKTFFINNMGSTINE